MRKSSITHYIIIFASLLLLWEMLSLMLCLSFLPPPGIVLENMFIELVPVISEHAVHSLIRILAGIAASVLIGAPIGLFMGYFKAFGRLMRPVVYFTYPVPKLALLPLVMLIFGLGEVSKILMISLIVVFQVIVASHDAVIALPEEAFHVMTSLGARTSAVFGRVILPASLPAILTAVRISVGTALSVLFFTETFGTEYGLGWYVMDSWMRVDYVDMFSGITALSLMGLMLFILTDVAERLSCPWRKSIE